MVIERDTSEAVDLAVRVRHRIADEQRYFGWSSVNDEDSLVSLAVALRVRRGGECDLAGVVEGNGVDFVPQQVSAVRDFRVHACNRLDLTRRVEEEPLAHDERDLVLVVEGKGSELV